MHLLILIFGIVLLPKATTLKCECDNPETCNSSEEECPSSGYQCTAMRMTTYANGSKQADFQRKACILAEHCVEGSVNFGNIRYVITNKCCTSDFCNAQPIPEPSKNWPNGKKCYQCNEQTCNTTLDCKGDEDHCFSATGVITGSENRTLKGCASKQLCPNSKAQFHRILGEESSCCQGDNCNSASGTRAGLLLLVAPLVSFIMFS